MIIRLRHREWLEDDQIAPAGPVHYRIVQVPEGTDADTLCSRFDGQVSLKEFVMDPVGSGAERSDGYCLKGDVRELEHRKTYTVFLNRKSYEKEFLERFKRIEDGEEIVK